LYCAGLRLASRLIFRVKYSRMRCGKVLTTSAKHSGTSKASVSNSKRKYVARWNSLVGCGARCRTGSFRSSQQYRFLQASAFGVAVNRRSVLPDDGHDETCVGGFFAVFRHRDKSSAPLRVKRRLARLQRSAGDDRLVQSKRRTKGRFFAAYPGT
jgi:hypothetical protein